MDKQRIHIALYAAVIYLISGTLAPAVAVTEPSWGNGTHFCGVSEYHPLSRQHSKRQDNRNYARTFANLNVGQPRTVRMIYFLPSDSQPQPDIDTQLDTLIKGAQHHYTEVMESHGFGRKTFTFETSRDGNAVVHHVDGRFTDAHYIDDTTEKVLEEIEGQFDTSENIYLIAIKISNHGLDNRTACGTGYFNGAIGGFALIPTSGPCFNVSVTAHELGHAFGLTHDYRVNAKFVSSSYTSDSMTTSFCAAEWLAVHRYFNAEQHAQNISNTTVQMRPPRLVSEPNTIRLRFEVSDDDGLHQAQLLTPEATYSGGLIGCKRLEGTSSTVEFVTAELTTKSNQVTLNVMDVHGNFTLHTFSIDIISLLPPSKTISIPDANLAAAVRQALNLSPNTVLTSHAMLTLTHLNAPNRGITDLTGLEYAHNLDTLWIGVDRWQPNPGEYPSSNAISDLSPLEGLRQLTWLELANPSRAAVSALPRLTQLRSLQIYNAPLSDVSVITNLTHLRTLDIFNPSISNVPAFVSAVGGLTQLRTLTLEGVSISDISPLLGLTQLTRLEVDTSVSDISPLAELSQLSWLTLNGSLISDISPLAGLTQLRVLGLVNTSVSDISPLAGLTQLRILTLDNTSVSDISPLAELSQLSKLTLNGSLISDISPLAGLTRLTELILAGNRSLSDISALVGLTRLTRLGLWDTSVSDISPLVGLPELTWLHLRRTRLNYPSLYTYIPEMQARGVVVHFDKRTPTMLRKISGVVTELDKLVAVEVRDNEGFPFEGVPVTFTFTSGGETVGVINTTTDENGRAESALILGTNVGTTTVSVSVTGIAQPVTFPAVAEAAVAIPDVNLRAAIETALGKASGATITTADMAMLPRLEAKNANITDLTGLEFATNLTELDLTHNSVSNIAPVTSLTQLTHLDLDRNPISDISAVADLTNLTFLDIWGTDISDISPVAGLTNLTTLGLGSNNISDISPVAGLTNLTGLYLLGNHITDISALSGLTRLKKLWLQRNNITDLYPLAANTGFGRGDTVNVSGNPLSYQSIQTYIPALQTRGVEVEFSDLKRPTLKYLLSIPAGISLIHVPLKVTAVDGAEQTLTSVSDLYAAIGGAGVVNFLITYDSQAGTWLSYFGPTDKGGASDKVLTDGTGIIAGLTAPVLVQLTGNPLGTGGTSTITLTPGLNLVGLPLNDFRLSRVSHLFALDGIRNNVPVIILTEGGGFQSVGRAGDPGDVPITGGQGFILTAQQAAQVTISGEGWANVYVSAAAPLMALKSFGVTDTTAVLALRGAVIDERTGLKGAGFRVTVKNLSTNRTIAGMTNDEGSGYRLTVVDIEKGQAAAIGDTLKIAAQPPDPFIGVEPLRYAVTAEDVKRGYIQLPELVAYYIPKETKLLANYPNPFNPETWIPYHLQSAADVTLTIYDTKGAVVLKLDLGHQGAGYYTDRTKAAYWDGRNTQGERVASGVYFYRLSAGDYSHTRQMVILK